MICYHGNAIRRRNKEQYPLKLIKIKIKQLKMY